MRIMKKVFMGTMAIVMGALFTSCNKGNEKEIIRVSHNQAADQTTKIVIIAFEK